MLAGQALLLLLAFAWHGGNDRMTAWLIGAFVVSAGLATFLTGIDRHAALAVQRDDTRAENPSDTLILQPAGRVLVESHARHTRRRRIGFCIVCSRRSTRIFA